MSVQTQLWFLREIGIGLQDYRSDLGLGTARRRDGPGPTLGTVRRTDGRPTDRRHVYAVQRARVPGVLLVFCRLSIAMPKRVRIQACACVPA